MKLDEQEIKQLLNGDAVNTKQSDEQSLLKVLESGKNITATKDILGLFIGWVWVVLVGFGASAYVAQQRVRNGGKISPKKTHKKLSDRR